MSVLRNDAVDGWLVLAVNARCAERCTGRARRQADERAARFARNVALEACGLRASHAFLSISHTEGSAAALASVGERLFGIDLVRISRVSSRHARAILSPLEYAAFGAMPWRYRDALAWALKEAAAKATGAAQHFFPHGVQLETDPATLGVCVKVADPFRTTFSTEWLVLGDLLCATVVSIARLPSAMSRVHAG